MGPGEVCPAHDPKDPAGEDRARPWDYFKELEARPIVLKRLFRDVHKRSRKYDSDVGGDVGQEALALVLVMKGSLSVGPAWSAERTPEWYEAAARALKGLATSRKVLGRAAWRLYGKKLPTQPLPDAEDGEDRFEDGDEADRARLREEQRIGRAFWASVKDAVDGGYATTESRRQFLDVLRVLAMLDGNGPLATGDAEAGGGDRPFGGGRKRNKTVQLNNHAVLSALQSRFPDQGWTIKMVQDCRAKLKAFMKQYRRAEPLVEMMGPPPIR